MSSKCLALMLFGSLVLMMVMGFDNKPALSTSSHAYDCGNENRIIRLYSFRLGPMPLVFPDVLQMHIDLEIMDKIPSQVDAHVRVEKQVTKTIWVRVPCMLQFGSCDYYRIDACLLTEEMFGCPIEIGRHNHTETYLLDSPETFNPNWLRGNYRTLVEINNSDTGEPLACFNFIYSINGSRW
uniref:GM2 activator protein n=1 Tax=Trichinella spiralis TaxID=6334 RepID=Q45GD0_TRISP|nr:GM2 activator protein [Trichinella spiralis]